VIGINGAAARLSKIGHKVIVMSFVWANPEDIRTHSSRVVILDEKNRIQETIDYKTQQ
jgi:aspartate 1-decarboxylase